MLKNTNAVSNTIGRARTASVPTVDRCSSVMRTAQASTDPTPEPVNNSTTARMTASRVSWTGPDSTSPQQTAKASAAVATVARVRPLEIRDTSHPASAPSGSATASNARITHWWVLGFPSMKTSLPSLTK